MYAFLDKRPAELAPAPRILINGLRLWGAALKSRQCAITTLNVLFQRWGLEAALWPAHNLFIWVGTHAQRTLALGCPSCGAISEDEALLLSAIFSEAGSENTTKAAVHDLVVDEAAANALRLVQRLQAELGVHKAPKDAEY